jgi:glycosyltransferase involved in cell wall biosynthesis
MSAELALIVPVLGRPHRVKPLLENIAEATPEPHRVLFIADSNDEVEIAELDTAGAEYITLEPPVNWARKVNMGYRKTTEPFFFAAADDLLFHSDWLPRAMAHMKPGIGIVGTNDLANPRVMCGQHATHMLIRRSYIDEQSGVVDEPRKVVHEQYPHEFADDELIQTAQARGAYAHAFDSLVQHCHPIVGPMAGEVPDDDTYRLGRSRTKQGRRLFHSRKHLWTAPQS